MTQSLKAEFANICTSFLREESGQDLIEYVFLVALIALACVVSIQGVATSIIAGFTKVSGQITAAVGS